MNLYRALIKVADTAKNHTEEYIAADTDAEAIAKFQAKGFVVLTLWRMVNIESIQ